jgi:hypothetical protein
LKTILQYIFYPISLLIGVPLEDCLAVGKLISIKAVINELVAYKELGATINFRKMILSNHTIYEMYKSGDMLIPSDITMLWNVIGYNYRSNWFLMFTFLGKVGHNFNLCFM